MRKLWSLGVQASLEEVVTVGARDPARAGRARPRAGAYVIGSPAIFRHVADAGQRIVNGTTRAAEADVVVVAGHDELRLRRAPRRDPGRPGRRRDDRRRPRPDLPHRRTGCWPGTGAIVAALEYATERTASAVGKPEPQIFLTALDRLGAGRDAGGRRPARRRPGRRRRGRARRRDRAHRRQHPRAGARRPPIPRRSRSPTTSHALLRRDGEARR